MRGLIALVQSLPQLFKAMITCHQRVPSPITEPKLIVIETSNPKTKGFPNLQTRKVRLLVNKIANPTNHRFSKKQIKSNKSTSMPRPKKRKICLRSQKRPPSLSTDKQSASLQMYQKYHKQMIRPVKLKVMKV